MNIFSMQRCKKSSGLAKKAKPHWKISERRPTQECRQSFAWGAHGAPSQKSKSHGAPWVPIGEIANISFQIKFSVTKRISPESFCNSALIPMKNFVILKSVLDLFEVF
jgi:hypothetical protein